MTPRITSTPLVVLIASLIFGTTFIALAERWSTDVTRVPVCVKPNGLVRVLTDRNPTCTSREQPLDWVVGGEVTDITLGEGLVGSRDDGRVELALDPSLLEACTGCRGSRVFAGFNDGPGTIPSNNTETIAELDLPAGSYAIFAKMTLGNVAYDSNTPNADRVHCRMSAEADSDEAVVTVEEPNPTIGWSYADTLGLQVVHHFPDPGSVVLSCHATDIGDDVIYLDLKIIAIEASQLSNVFVEDP